MDSALPAVSCRWLACLNPHSYAGHWMVLPFSPALHAADWLIPDGAGIVLASKPLGGQIRQQPPAATSSARYGHIELNRLGGYQ